MRHLKNEKVSLPPILRRISYPPRSGIREHFIIRVTVANEQTRADNATLRENATPVRERARDRRDARVTHIQTNKDRSSSRVTSVSRAVPFYFVPRLPSSLVSAIKLTPSSFFFFSPSSAEQKLVLALIRIASFAHRVFEKWKEKKRRTRGVDLIWLGPGIRNHAP